MKKFFISLFHYGLVLLGVFTISCLLIRRHYHTLSLRQKNDSIIHILILGDSHPMYSINENLVNHSLKQCSSGEPYFYSLLKLDLYKSIHPDITTLILGISYHSFNKNVDARIDTYSSYMSIYPKIKHIKPLVKIEDYLSLKTRLKVSFGYKFGIPSKDCIAELKNEFIGFESFGEPTLINTINRHYYTHSGNINDLSSIQIKVIDYIVQYCKKSNITLVLYNAPVRKEYLASIPYLFIQTTDSIANSYTDNKHIYYLNHTDYPLSDTCFSDYDHLNMNGANIITPILRDSLISLGVLK